MAKKKVFVSFDYDNDKHYKALLKAWDANPMCGVRSLIVTKVKKA